MTKQEKDEVKRIKDTLSTLICWLRLDLGQDAVSALLDMMRTPDNKRKTK